MRSAVSMVDASSMPRGEGLCLHPSERRCRCCRRASGQVNLLACALAHTDRTHELHAVYLLLLNEHTHTNTNTPALVVTRPGQVLTRG